MEARPGAYPLADGPELELLSIFLVFCPASHARVSTVFDVLGGVLANRQQPVRRQVSTGNCNVVLAPRLDAFTQCAFVVCPTQERQLLAEIASEPTGRHTNRSTRGSSCADWPSWSYSTWPCSRGAAVVRIGSGNGSLAHHRPSQDPLHRSCPIRRAPV